MASRTAGYRGESAQLFFHAGRAALRADGLIIAANQNLACFSALLAHKTEQRHLISLLNGLSGREIHGSPDYNKKIIAQYSGPVLNGLGTRSTP